MVFALSNSEKGQQDKSMCDIQEGHQVSECLILAVSWYTEKNLQGISLREQAVLNMLNFCLCNGSLSPA